jgi:predicted Zn-dependent peptidase
MIYKTISQLLIERQNAKANSAHSPAPATTASTADELKKYKELLDAGIITQEEFDAKKKQLLGL